MSTTTTRRYPLRYWGRIPTEQLRACRDAFAADLAAGRTEVYSEERCVDFIEDIDAELKTRAAAVARGKAGK